MVTRQLTGGVTPEQAQELMALLRKIDDKKPKEADVLALREALEKIPGAWRAGGDLQQIMTLEAIEHMNAGAGTREFVRAGLPDMRAGLGYAGAVELERMLIDHVLLCWVRLQLAEHRYQNMLSESVTLPVGDFYERRLTATQARYLRAVETLARVRRLLHLPAVQVNIADKQVNIAG